MYKLKQNDPEYSIFRFGRASASLLALKKINGYTTNIAVIKISIL